MSGEAMRDWREARGLSRAAFAKLIDMAPSMVEVYERGFQYKGGKEVPAEIPKRVRLAMAALAMGILDYDGVDTIGPPSFVTALPQEREENDDK